jgi:hypothetical protein
MDRLSGLVLWPAMKTRATGIAQYPGCGLALQAMAVRFLPF